MQVLQRGMLSGLLCFVPWQNKRAWMETTVEFYDKFDWDMVCVSCYTM
jgi:hypothetical protein